MAYNHKGEKYFDYENPEEVKQTWKKLFEWGFRFIVQSKYHSFQSRISSIFPGGDRTIRDLHFDMDYEKISLGIGMEFLLKANTLKNGYVIHKINGYAMIKQISSLTTSDEIHYGKMLSLEYFKNHLLDFDITTEKNTFQTLELIQEWRNGIIHQARGRPGGENGAQWLAIQNTFALLNNQLVE